MTPPASRTPLWIGLMSGTSMDAVDGALVEFRRRRHNVGCELVAFESVAIDESLRSELLSLQAIGNDELARAARAARGLTEVYAAVSSRLIRVAGNGGAVRAIGAHGQTVRHAPQHGYTIQLLHAALLAERCGVDVVADFRAADIAAGGQGAPLAPAFHRDAFGDPRHARVVVNLGGIANVSLLPAGDGAVVGYDTGPGNMLLDAWCRHRRGEAFDRDGAWGASGRIDDALLARLRAEPYFALPPPKSTGRDLFDLDWLLRHDVERLAPEDVQATLAELTATTVADACRAFDAETVYLCGGGAHNRALVERIATRLAPIRVATTDALGIDPQAVEAVAFAWLARQRWIGRPANLPSVTGAAGPRVLGALYPASRKTSAPRD